MVGPALQYNWICGRPCYNAYLIVMAARSRSKSCLRSVWKWALCGRHNRFNRFYRLCAVVFAYPHILWQAQYFVRVGGVEVAGAGNREVAMFGGGECLCDAVVVLRGRIGKLLGRAAECVVSPAAHVKEISYEPLVLEA